MDDSADAEAFQETAKVPQVMEPTPAAANEAHVSVAVQENKAESTKADSNVAGDTEQDQDHKSNAGSDWETEEDASAAASDSSSDSEAESIATLDDMQRLQNDCAKHFTSETFFNAYTQRLKEKARNRRGKNQGSTLVKGLVDYMRTLEERISSLEESQDAGSEANTEPGHVETDIYDAQVKLDIKFFDEAAYTYDNIFYAQAHSREEKGTFMCGHDDQHLIRVLYSKHAEAKPKPQKLGKLADPDPPNPSEINMLLCNISSKAIARFFVKILNCNPTDVIRFGNPFRPIIGNIGLIRDHLRKLEGLYGSNIVLSEAAAEGSSEAQRNTNGGSTPSNSSINQKGSDAADFPFNDGQIDNVQAYDQPAALQHFRLFLDFVDKYLGDKIAFAGEEYARPGLDQSPHVPVTRYTPQAYRVVATDGGMPHRSTIGFPTSGAANDGLDTTTFSATMAYPMAYAPSNDLHTRGQRFLEATKVSHLQYEGLTVGPLREEINSPVVVDIKLAYEGGRDIAEALIKVPIISPGCTYDCYNTGQATQGHKMLTDADLVLEEYERRGCIILLHGVPGVGKTSTAECVAAHTKKPLYPITCGDVGYKAEDVERNMESHFKLAHRWGCVLLLDEADVFLARRDEQQKDVQRNGLVSEHPVFLRILEYYSGILFLTTNRVGDIDEAFRSRLHLTLYYPKLKRKQTKKIFKRNFERINDVNQGRTEHGIPPFIYKDSEPKIMQWAGETYKTLQWNGRQIRNTFQTVLALAEFHAKQRDGDAYSPVVTKKLFKIVANAAILFNEYLAATHGADQDKMAQQTYIRANSFEPSKEHRFTSLADDTSESSSQEDDSSSNDSGSDSDESDSSDDAQESMKKSSNAKKGKQSKRSSRKKRKSSAKEKKSEKKSKDKKKEKKKDESSDSDS
uniref:AAA+ ATPase domain-containing protein n=1 Tax=Pestalotiopsis fici TaxID=393283 RepID=A0A067XNX0_9PEZI|nr:hypothetical protein [Pestalotiopsis fici]